MCAALQQHPTRQIVLPCHVMVKRNFSSVSHSQCFPPARHRTSNTLFHRPQHQESAFATQQVSLRKCQDVMHIILSRQDWWATYAHILLQWHMAIGSMHSVSCSKPLQGQIMCCGHAGLMLSTRDAARPQQQAYANRQHPLITGKRLGLVANLSHSLLSILSMQARGSPGDSLSSVMPQSPGQRQRLQPEANPL